MELDCLTPSERTCLDEMLGYLNFSSGVPDCRFQTHCNVLYHRLDAPGTEPWRQLQHLLVARLAQLGAETGSGSPFADPGQAEAVVDIVFRRLLEAYRRFHRDLLYHQSDRTLFGPFFLARACEAVLAVGGPWSETDRIVDEAIGRLNDFIGYRPVAVLRTRQRIEPYAHEWVRPLPLYVSGAGVEHGVYHDLILGALDILRNTDDDIRRQASFDPEHLDELALDPRAYDFDHPVNKRPNYHFGQWDPHRIDSRGNYRRFVLQGVTLEAIWQRTAEANSLPPDERLFEACIVLAGTILMGSAVSGGAPDTYDSNTTLATLVPRIVACRDAFYERALKRVAAAHGGRLREEAARLRQPFGGARQHLNQRLARLRATQLEHVHLAQLFARMGYPEASARKSRVVPVASARILCEISSRFTTGHRYIRQGQLDDIVQLVDEIDGLLRRGIECGALVDPWNILGFQGQFSLFPAIENSVRDHRVDVLIHVMREVFSLLVRLAGEAAASGNDPARQAAVDRLTAMAGWWDEFASVEVAGIEHVSGQESVDSAEPLASALGAWRAAGESAGDLAFWRKHVEGFDSPKPYALVIASLLDRKDLVASRALLMHWIGQADRVPLSEGDHSFHDLALRWMQCTIADEVRRSSEISKFFDHLEANAEILWEVPELESDPSSKDALHADGSDEDDDGDDLYCAAYEDVVYRDTTSDGTESSTMDSGPPRTDFALDAESERLDDRLTFHITLARLWSIATQGKAGQTSDDDWNESVKGWLERAQHNAAKLEALLDAVSASRLPEPIGTQESMVEYDRCRLVKESLLAKVVFATTQTAAARRALLVAVDLASAPATDVEECNSCEKLLTELCRALDRGDARRARDIFPKLRDQLDALPVLYIPLARRGDPRRIVATQGVHQILLDLSRLLPRAGLLAEACQLVHTAQTMERHRPAGDGVVSEFDRVFESAYAAIVESLIDALPEASDHEHELVEILEQLTDALMQRWTDHSRSLRLSVLEKINSREHWQRLVEFIER
ncbi:MAG TPA: hypothetical protein VHV77_05330, partial [Pirellulales bacterium]|nr:hypothetical protein [Pirellulales bacterium]